MRILCKYKDEGCESVVKLEHLLRHEIEECEYKRVECRYSDCKLIMPKIEIQEHENTCEKRLILCGDCGDEYKFADIDNHSCIKFLGELIVSLSIRARENELKIHNLENTLRQNGIEQSSFHPGIACDNCRVDPIVGARNICLDCQNYNLCWKCKPIARHPHNNYFQLIKSGDHEGVTCDGCQIHPINGIRFKCKECPNFGIFYLDFCHDCKLNQPHDKHEFLAWAPYFISVRSVGETQIAYRTGEVMKRSFEIENFGNDPITNIILNCIAGEHCSNL